MEKNKVIDIYTEANPNPNSLKFVLNFNLLPQGKSVDFPDLETATVSPLAKTLFSFPFTERVFYMGNFITLTKKEGLEWAEVIPQVKEKIRDFFQTDQALFTGEPKEALAEEQEAQESELEQKIKGILDEYVKPAVEMDGGAIVFKSFEETEGILRVQLQGSCSGCPSSILTLKSGIENLMQRLIPQVKAVEAEDA